MLRTLPRLLRRDGAALVHTQYAVPVRSPCPAVVTIHDLSFEHGSAHMALKDRLVFRRVVPRAARAARRVLTVSERTRADLVRLYGLPEEKVVVTPNGVDPAFAPGNTPAARHVRARRRGGAAAEEPPGGTRCRRGGPAAARRRRPREGRGACGASCAMPARICAATSPRRSSPSSTAARPASCSRRTSRALAFPMLEAMASGTPVVALDEPALREVGGDAAVFVEEAHLADGMRRALDERDELAAAGLERARAFSWRVTAERTLEVYREALGVTVSAIVVSHGHARELEESLPALAPQVDELVVIANLPGSVGALPAGARVLESPRPRTFAANVNAGVAATTGEYVLVSNPDAVPEPGAVAALVRFADAHPRAGLVGPLVFWPDGTWQPSLRRFPDVLGTVWRRTPLRLLRRPYEHQVSHYGTRPAEPVQGDWLLGGACLLMRRSMLEEIGGWDAGFRHYVEDIDVAYRAAKAGWERWLVPEAVVHHAYAAVIDKRFLSRHTLWHLRGMARFVRKHPERLLRASLAARAG